MNDSLTQEQPQPTPGHLKVSYLIGVMHSQENASSERSLVMRDVLRRLDAGAQKYGSELMTHNGRSADLDLYQELCDGIAYLTQVIFETVEEADVIPLIEDADSLYTIAARCRLRLVTAGILSEDPYLEGKKGSSL